MGRRSKNKSIPSKKAYNSFELKIHDIMREHVRIDDKDLVAFNKVFHEFLDRFLGLMKATDNMFCSMHPCVMFVGSKFEGLRVGMPTEYDVNIVLKLPLNKKTIVLDCKDAPVGFTSIIMPAEFRRLSQIDEKISEGFKKTVDWCDRNNCLLQTKFRAWMQSVITRTFNALPASEFDTEKCLEVNGKCYFISQSTSASGLANTIKIRAEHLREDIDVDLVPSLQLPINKLPIESGINKKLILASHKKTFYAVPKPVTNSSDTDNFWRLAFPQQERELLVDRKHAKPILRLIKRLRDALNFGGLASYFIKTVFLLQLEKEDDVFWENSLSYLLLYMIKVLKEHLNAGKIPDYWNRERNLIESIQPVTLSHWCNRLDSVINVFENFKHSPETLKKFFD